MYNDEQKAVINHLSGPAAVLAGAGSGKTATLIGRIESLSRFTNPRRIVMLTFTNAAADEMKARASKINTECKNVVATTYHKYCGLMLRKYGKIIGIDPSFEILTGMKYKTFIEYVKSESEYYEDLKDFPSSTKLDTIFSQIVNCNASIPSLIYNTKYSKYANEIRNLFDEVKKAGYEQQKLNFDDMLIYMNKLLDVDEICEKIANSFDFLMVDEFQDTNELQLRMLLKLSKYNKNIVIVGDLSQSIYKFRGAKVQNIQDFIDSFEDCDVYNLSINYRSTQQILDATNDIMNQYVQSWDYTNMKSDNKTGNLPIIRHHHNDFDQAQWVINKIEESVNNGFDLSQIAIIERKSISSFKLETELTKAKIPFIKRGGLKFTEYVCIDEMLSFFSVISKKHDRFSWFNILKLIPGIGNKNATNIASVCKNEDFLLNYSKNKYGKDLAELHTNLILYKQDINNLPVLFDNIANYYFGLREAKIENSKMSNSSKFDAREKIEKDKKIVNILKDMSSNYKDLKEFIDDIALDTVRTSENTEDQLVITTIHSAKGLEWPIVILLDCIEYETKDEEEELRCLYVALTRAEDDLTISIPDYGIENGNPVYNDVSHFITSSIKYFNEVSA